MNNLKFRTPPMIPNSRSSEKSEKSINALIEKAKKNGVITKPLNFSGK